MPKNLVICCDGTANKFGTTNTNVVKLYSTLVHDPGQIAYYHPGLGTMGSPAALTRTSRALTILAGKAFGYGLTTHIQSAYLFLMEYYEPGDKVYLFGFSRGAYTVRSLAAALHMFGLLRKGNERLTPYLSELFTAKVDEVFRVAGDFKRTFSIECKPHFLGVWDTVTSVGRLYNPVRLPYTFRNPDIMIGRQAISVDERRCFFRQNLIATPRPGQDIRQVWFAGVHCDVGGGYLEKESGLSNIALDWMLEEAQRAGLRLDPSKRAELGKPDPLGPIHRSLSGIWWIAEFMPRPVTIFPDGKPKRIWTIPAGRRRTIHPDAQIHPSVFQRREDRNSDYHPPNIPFTARPVTRENP